MRAGPCKIPRLEQIRMSAAGECIGLIADLMGLAPTVHSARRMAYIKQVFDLCEDNPSVPYGPPTMTRMVWGDWLDRLVERHGDEHLCPECGHLLDVPTYQRGEVVCLRDGCGYRAKLEGEKRELGDYLDGAGD